jgi:hypothetical protein
MERRKLTCDEYRLMVTDTAPNARLDSEQSQQVVEHENACTPCHRWVTLVYGYGAPDFLLDARFEYEHS